MHGSDFTATLSLARGPKRGNTETVDTVFTDGPSDLVNAPSNGEKTYASIAKLVLGTKRVTGPAVYGSSAVLIRAMDHKRGRAFARIKGIGTEGDYEGSSHYGDEGESPPVCRICSEQVVL
jgi:hypothetical protein